MRSLRPEKTTAKKPRRTKPPVPLARFRIYGYKSSLYFVVQVFATKDDLHAQRRIDELEDDPHCDAYCFSYDIIKVYPDDRPNRKRPIVGEINFHRDRLGVGAISHECTHAAAALLRRLRFDFADLNDDELKGGCDMNAEEVFAYSLGEFARQITVQLYKRKLIDG